MSGLYGASIPRYMIGMSGSSSRSVSARLTIPDLLGEIERLRATDLIDRLSEPGSGAAGRGTEDGSPPGCALLWRRVAS